MWNEEYFFANLVFVSHSLHLSQSLHIQTSGDPSTLSTHVSSSAYSLVQPLTILFLLPLPDLSLPSSHSLGLPDGGFSPWQWRSRMRSAPMPPSACPLAVVVVVEAPSTTRFSFRRLATRTVMRVNPSPPGPPPSWVGKGARVVGWEALDTFLVRLSPPDTPLVPLEPTLLNVPPPPPPFGFSLKFPPLDPPFQLTGTDWCEKIITHYFWCF